MLLQELRQFIGFAALAEFDGFVDELLGRSSLRLDLGQGRLLFLGSVRRIGKELLQLLRGDLVFLGLAFDVLRLDVHIFGRGGQHEVAQRDGALAHRFQHLLDQCALGILDLHHMGEAPLHLVHVEDAEAGHQHQQQDHPRKPQPQARTYLHS